jgi:hypothetical protein
MKPSSPRLTRRRTRSSDKDDASLNDLVGDTPTIARVAAGVLHDVPEDMRDALTSDPGLLARWNDLTPIQRNEWICWTTIVKKPETRADHVRRMCSGLREGKRQPCCWPGCPHRRPKAEKWFRNV